MELVKSIGLDMTNIDNMAAGPFNNRSYYGYKGKILKSGICKYYRRKQFDKFEWCIIEMMLFGFKNKVPNNQKNSEFYSSIIKKSSVTTE